MNQLRYHKRHYWSWKHRERLLKINHKYKNRNKWTQASESWYIRPCSLDLPFKHKAWATIKTALFVFLLSGVIFPCYLFNVWKLLFHMFCLVDSCLRLKCKSGPSLLHNGQLCKFTTYDRNSQQSAYYCLLPYFLWPSLSHPSDHFHFFP